MITKFSEAHERLLAQLQVRTHRRREDLPPERTAKVQSTAKGQPRRVVVNGKTYPSVTQARKACGVGITRLYDWLNSGKANYA